MKLVEMLNANNVYLFHLSGGRELVGQLTQEGDDFVQIGSRNNNRMEYRWLNKDHVVEITFLATTFQEAEKKLEG